jgi:hypothetical protein
MVPAPAAAAAFDHATGQAGGETQQNEGDNEKTTHGDSRELGNRPSDAKCRKPERAIQASALTECVVRVNKAQGCARGIRLNCKG